MFNLHCKPLFVFCKNTIILFLLLLKCQLLPSFFNLHASSLCFRLLFHLFECLFLVLLHCIEHSISIFLAYLILLFLFLFLLIIFLLILLILILLLLIFLILIFILLVFIFLIVVFTFLILIAFYKCQIIFGFHIARIIAQCFFIGIFCFIKFSHFKITIAYVMIHTGQTHFIFFVVRQET